MKMSLMGKRLFKGMHSTVLKKFVSKIGRQKD
jgi:hypothetical protein